MDEDETDAPPPRYSSPRERIFEEQQREKKDPVFGKEELEELLPEEVLFGEKLPEGMSIEEGDE